MNEVHSLLWTQLWQVTIVVVFVLLAVKLLARKRPHLAHALWILVLLKCVTPPVFSCQLSPFSWLAVKSSGSESMELLADFPGQGDEIFATDSVAVEAPGFSIFRNEAFGTSGESIQGSLEYASTPFAFDWPAVLVAVWILGVLICGSLQIFRLTRFLFKVRKSPAAENSNAAALLESVSRKIGLRKQVRLLVTEMMVSPAVIGLIRPTILLPATIAAQSEKELEPLIAHELIHVRRGDLWWALLQMIVGSLFWFHPLIRMAVTAVTRESELSCDEETIASLGCNPTDYAYSLLKILEQRQTLEVAPAVPGVKPVELTTTRLERVMKLGHGSHKRTPWWTWIVLMLCSAIVLPGAGLLDAQEQPDSDPPNAEAQVKSAPLLTETYLIKGIIERLAEKQPSAKYEELEKQFKNHVDAFLAAMKSEVPSFRTTQMYEGRLIASLPRDDHERLREYLAKVRDNGFRQIVVEMRIAAGAEIVDALDWQEQDSAVLHRAKGELARNSHPQQVLQATYESDVSKMQHDLVDVVSLMQSDDLSDATHKLRADNPLTQATQQVLINDAQVGKLTLLASGKDMSITQAPTIALFDGQDGMVTDAVMRPFVTSTQPIVGDMEVANQPLFSIVPEGTKVLLETEIDGDKVKLSGSATMSQVVEVNTFTFDGTSDKGLPGGVTIQLPVVSATSLEFDALVEDGETLCLKTASPGDPKNELVLMLTPRIVESDGLELNAIVKPDSSHGELVRVEEQRDDKTVSAYYSKDDVEYFKLERPQNAYEARFKKHGIEATSDEVDRAIELRATKLGLSVNKFQSLMEEKRSYPEATLRHIFKMNVMLEKLAEAEQQKIGSHSIGLLMIRSREDGKNWAEDVFKFHEGGFGPMLQKTDAVVEISGDIAKVRGASLEVVADGEVYAAGDKVELLVDGGTQTIKLDGNAQLSIGGQMKADSIHFEVNQDSGMPIVRLEGNVIMKTETSTITSDSLRINQESNIVLKGSAKIQFDGSEKPNIVGDIMKVLSDGTVFVDGKKLGPKFEL